MMLIHWIDLKYLYSVDLRIEYWTMSETEVQFGTCLDFQDTLMASKHGDHAFIDYPGSVT